MPEITAAVIIALKNLNDKILTKKIDEGIKFLIKYYNTHSLWNSYWWNGDYASSKVMQALAGYPEAEVIVKKAREGIITKPVEKIPFYLALNIVASADYMGYEKQTINYLKKLLTYQKPDGSFESYPILQFPYPSIKEPWNNMERWREDAKDQNRIFTTATAYFALSKLKLNLIH